MYEKYQEAADALRHERWERKHSEAILERVLLFFCDSLAFMNAILSWFYAIFTSSQV